jgi:hypothetical protein
LPFAVARGVVPVHGDADLVDDLVTESQRAHALGHQRETLDLSALGAHPHHVGVRDALLIGQLHRQLDEEVGHGLHELRHVLGDEVLVLGEPVGRGHVGNSLSSSAKLAGASSYMNATGFLSTALNGLTRGDSVCS